VDLESLFSKMYFSNSLGAHTVSFGSWSNFRLECFSFITRHCCKEQLNIKKYKIMERDRSDCICDCSQNLPNIFSSFIQHQLVTKFYVVNHTFSSTLIIFSLNYCRKCFSNMLKRLIFIFGFINTFL
jgi:hypothetical protein